MTEDQLEAWRKALADLAAQKRRQRHRPRARGVQAVGGAGMVRIPARRGDDGPDRGTPGA
jgi:hypothetical protein